MLKISIFRFFFYLSFLIDTLIYGEQSYMESQFEARKIDSMYITYPKNKLNVSYPKFIVNPEQDLSIPLEYVASVPSVEFPKTVENYKAIIMIEYYHTIGSHQTVQWMVANIPSNNDVNSAATVLNYKPPETEQRSYIFLAYGVNNAVDKSVLSAIHRNTNVRTIQMYLSETKLYAGNILYIQQFKSEGREPSYMEKQFQRLGIDESIVSYPRENLTVNYCNYKVNPEINSLHLSDVSIPPNVYFPVTAETYKVIILIDYYKTQEGKIEQNLFWMIGNIVNVNDVNTGDPSYPYKPPKQKEHFYLFLAYKTNEKISPTFGHKYESVHDIQTSLHIGNPYAGNILYIKEILSKQEIKSYMENQFKHFGIDESIVPYPKKNLSVYYRNYEVKAEEISLRLSDVAFAPNVTFPTSKESFKCIIMMEYYGEKGKTVNQKLHWMVANIADLKNVNSGKTFFNYTQPMKVGHFYLFLAYKSTKILTNMIPSNTVQNIQAVNNFDKPYAGNILYIKKFLPEETVQERKHNYIEDQFERLNINNTIVPYPREFLTVVYPHYRVNPEDNFLNLIDLASQPIVSFPPAAESHKILILIDYYVNQKDNKIKQILQWMVANIVNRVDVKSGSTFFDYKQPNEEGHFYLFLAYKTNKTIPYETTYNMKTTVRKIQTSLDVGDPYAGNILYIKRFTTVDKNESYIEGQFKHFGIDNSVIPYPKKYLEVIYPHYEVNPSKNFMKPKDVECEPNVHFPPIGGKYKILIMIELQKIQHSPHKEQSLHWMVVNIDSDKDVRSGETIFKYRPPTKEEHLYIFLAYDTNETKYMDALPPDLYHTSVTDIQMLIGIEEPFAGNILYVEKYISEGTRFTTSVVLKICIIICYFLLRRN